MNPEPYCSHRAKGFGHGANCRGELRNLHTFQRIRAGKRETVTYLLCDYHSSVTRVPRSGDAK